jgi:hypothetical protein
MGVWAPPLPLDRRPPSDSNTVALEPCWTQPPPVGPTEEVQQVHLLDVHLIGGKPVVRRPVGCRFRAWWGGGDAGRERWGGAGQRARARRRGLWALLAGAQRSSCPLQRRARLGPQKRRTHLRVARHQHRHSLLDALRRHRPRAPQHRDLGAHRGLGVLAAAAAGQLLRLGEHERARAAGREVLRRAVHGLTAGAAAAGLGQWGGSTG